MLFTYTPRLNLPLYDPFIAAALDSFIQQQKPTQIEMTDKQYAHLSGLLRKNPRAVGTIPIVFIDAPTA